MTYAYTGAANVQVDLFNIAAPEQLKIASGAVIADGENLVTETGRRFQEVSYLRERALSRADEIADQLYETAPQEPVGPSQTVYGRHVLQLLFPGL